MSETLEKEDEMREVKKLESVTCDWCGAPVDDKGLNAGVLRVPLDSGEFLEIRLKLDYPSEEGRDTARTQVSKDICEKCWRERLV